MNRKFVSRFIAVLVCCCMLLSTVSSGVLAAYSSSQIKTYIAQGYQYEKSGGSVVLSEAEAKAALSESTDLIVLSSGRDVGNTAMTDAEFENYLGYVNVNLRGGNGTYKAADFLRAALAVGAAGGDSTSVGKDVNGNRVDLLYKGVYSRSITTLEKDGAKTVAYALLALDANDISNDEMRSFGSKVTRDQLKDSLIRSAKTMSGQSVPDVGTAALVLSALSPYYCNGESSVVSACDDLLDKISGLQGENGMVKDSTTATADVIVALCSMNIDPSANEYFKGDLIHGLLTCYNSDGGFAPGSSSSGSTSLATSSARCAMVAYCCFDKGEFFYDFSSVKAHNVKNITTSTGNSTNNSTNNNSSSGNNSSANKNNSSSNKNNSNSSANKNNSSSSTNKNNSSSSTNKNNSSTLSAGANTRSITAQASTDKIVAKSVFEDLKGKDETYLYEGTWGEEEPYTISFNGKDITNPMDFNAEISNITTHQMEIDAASGTAEYISFLHEGAFPGKATATITVSVADGSYQCYRYDDAEGSFVEVSKVTVSDGMVSFEVEVGGDYFITDGEVSTENIAMSVDDTVDGVVPASVFENIMGKNTDLVLSGETERGVRYEITFNGANIETPMDFNMQMTETTAYWDQISKLADGPLVLHFDHDGAIPGPASVKVYANLDKSLTYGLFYFDPVEATGTYSSAITVGDGEISFNLNHCSDYFIAEYTGETFLDGGMNILMVLLIVLGALIVIGGVTFLVLRKVYGKEGLKEKLGAVSSKMKMMSKTKKKKKGSGEEISEELAEGEEPLIDGESLEDGEVVENDEAEDELSLNVEGESLESVEVGEEVIVESVEETPADEEIVAEVSYDESSFANPNKD